MFKTYTPVLLSSHASNGGVLAIARDMGESRNTWLVLEQL